MDQRSRLKSHFALLKPLQLRLPWLPCGRCSQSFFVFRECWVRMRPVPLAPSLLLPSQLRCCKARFSAMPKQLENHMSSAQHSCLGQGQWVGTCMGQWVSEGEWDLTWPHIPTWLITSISSSAVLLRAGLKASMRLATVVARSLLANIQVPGLQRKIMVVGATPIQQELHMMQQLAAMTGASSPGATAIARRKSRARQLALSGILSNPEVLHGQARHLDAVTSYILILVLYI